MENIEHPISSDGMTDEELLSIGKPHHDGSKVELETNLEQRFQEKRYDWLVDVEQFSKQVSFAN